jgi:tRNA(Ile)-lysidine synthase
MDILSADTLRQRLAQIWPPSSVPGQRFAVACSGGADSMALTLMIAEAYPTHVTALIVDHGLRADSANEAAQVSGWLSARNIAHEILTWQADKPSSGLQVAARDARYTLMAGRCETLGIPALLTAHHADDQAETVLLALQRGAGLNGLAAMPAARTLGEITLLRPLLDIPKMSLVNMLQALSQDWIEDSSNANPRFDRVQIRAAMATLAPLGITMEALNTTARHLDDARALVNEQITAFKSKAIETPESITLPRALLTNRSASFHRVITRAALTDWLTALGSRPRGADVMRLIAWIEADCPGGTRMLARCQIDGADPAHLILTPEPEYRR